MKRAEKEMMRKGDVIAEEHGDWFVSVFASMMKTTFVEAFIHGYKHGVLAERARHQRGG